MDGGDMFPLHETDLDSTLQEKINLAVSGAPFEPYPDGSIYLNVVNTNPVTLFGRTWEQL